MTDPYKILIWFPTLSTSLVAITLCLILGLYCRKLAIASAPASDAAPRPDSQTAILAASIALFGILITGVFVFMAFRVDTGARLRAEQTATEVATQVAMSQAQEIATRIAEQVAATEAARVAAETAADVADTKAARVAADTATATATEVAAATAAGTAATIATDIAIAKATEVATIRAEEVAAREAARVASETATQVAAAEAASVAARTVEQAAGDLTTELLAQVQMALVPIEEELDLLLKEFLDTWAPQPDTSEALPIFPDEEVTLEFEPETSAIFVLEVDASGTYSIDAAAIDDVDPIVTVYIEKDDGSIELVALDDDSGTLFDAYLEMDLDGGTRYYLEVSEVYGDTGTCTVFVTKV